MNCHYCNGKITWTPFSIYGNNYCVVKCWRLEQKGERNEHGNIRDMPEVHENAGKETDTASRST